jgi:lipoyl(octanoyl) transferase
MIATSRKMRQITENRNEILLLPASGSPANIGSSIFGNATPSQIDVFCHPECDPDEAMNFDHNRAEAVARREARPMLRLYSWKPFAVSLGAHQRERDICLEACAAHGLSVVRRPTGGRAVLHAAELTYSVVVPLTSVLDDISPLFQLPRRTAHDVYQAVHLFLQQALTRLGIKGIEFEKTQPNFRALYRSGSVAMPCFASSARYELVHHGRKVVGSAQKLYGNGTVVLQHGSILLDTGHERLADVLRLNSESERETIRQLMHDRTATLSEIAGRRIGFDECAEAILTSFASP